MNLTMAENKYHCYLRDRGFIGELPIADRNTSMKSPQGDWLLKDNKGNKIAIIFKNGRIIG